MATHTRVHTPPTKQSDEATQQQLKMARTQGDALERALKHMMQEEADDGKEVAAGDYKVGYAVEAAEGMYMMRNGELEWKEPQAENVHLEISVRDGADGRFVPALKVQATLVDPDGNKIGTHQQPFLWHPWLYHYGRNWQVPGDGTYSLHVQIEAPDFGRHDKENGKRFAKPVEVTFNNVKIKTGQK